MGHERGGTRGGNTEQAYRPVVSRAVGNGSEGKRCHGAASLRGDATIDLVLGAYERAHAEGSIAERRWVIEHGFIAQLDQFPRMRALGLAVSAQNHCAEPTEVLGAGVGGGRAGGGAGPGGASPGRGGRGLVVGGGPARRRHPDRNRACGPHVRGLTPWLQGTSSHRSSPSASTSPATGIRWSRSGSAVG